MVSGTVAEHEKEDVADSSSRYGVNLETAGDNVCRILSEDVHSNRILYTPRSSPCGGVNFDWKYDGIPLAWDKVKVF